ncbi:MAG: hypothetical protein IPL79_07390 [Myxococcales bacterium]|nr:hypothetical protein [Myxococcales bacterium]
MKRLQSLVLACCVGLAFGAVGVACGGSDEPPVDDPDPPPPPPPPPGPCETIDNPDEFPDCFQTALCEKLLSCGLGNVGDNSCADVVPGYFPLGGISYQQVADGKEAIDAGRSEFDSAAATACLNGVLNATCLDLFIGEDVYGDACENILVGQGGAGDPCSADNECGDGFYCDDSVEGSGTTCEPLGECAAYAADGASCASASCGNGSYCINDTCETGTLGEPCYGDSSCDDGFECITGSVAAGGIGACQAIDVAAEGDACDNPGDLCDGNEFICIPATENALTGTCELPDTAGANCIELCGGGLGCVYEVGSNLGECTAMSGFADVGDECDELSPRLFGSPCGLFLTCRFGPDKGDPATCQNPGSEGDPCGFIALTSGGPGFGDCNLGLFCSNEIINSPDPVCVKPGENGAFCDSDSHCAEGTCGPSGRCGEPVACEGEIIN